MINTMSTHYVCKGICGGESSVPSMCHAEGCNMTGKPLMECKCIDGRHGRDGDSATQPVQSAQ